jgi:Xaa-Pro dipeptidase
MSKDDFTREEFNDRQSRVRTAMAQRGLDLLIVISPVNINYLIGARAKSFQKFQCLLFPLEDGPLTFFTRLSEVAEVADTSLADEVVPWNGGFAEDPIEAFARLARDRHILDCRVGLEVPYYYLGVHDYLKLKAVLGEALVAEASDLIEPLKFVKSPAEIAYIRKASAINDMAMQSCCDTIAEGVSELAVAGEIVKALMCNGSHTPVSAINFAAGDQSCYAHPHPCERPLERGDFMHVEYGASYHQYTSTIGRQLCLGEPTARMEELYAVVRAACDACIAAIKPGVPATAPHMAATEVISDAGLDAHRWHLTGYGVAPGFPPTWNESMWMFDGSPYLLEEGMVVSVEPPVFVHEERLGVRLVDNVLVGKTGGEVLSKFNRDLLVCPA